MSETPIPRSTTNERLLSTAAKLFWEKGFAGTSTRELSERLGIQKASLYYHIRSKEDLLYQISIQSLDNIQQAVMEASANAKPGETLRDMIRAHMQAALTDRDMQATMLTEMRTLSEERRSDVRAKRDMYERTLHETIRAEQSAGRLRADLDSQYLTLSLLNLLNWTIFWYKPEGEKSIVELADFFYTIFVSGAGSAADA
jgi:AcrR family transcriptional regulator